MKHLTLKNIITAVRGEYFGDPALLKREISFVTKDSREVKSGCLFAAIKGENVDGHDYIATACKNGALCAIGERVPIGSSCPVIVVGNTIAALGDLAMFYRLHFHIPVIGITGSVGKTTAKEMISSVLSQRFKVHKTPSNLNNDLGVPLTVFGIDESTQVAVIEMGISHFGEMTRLAEIVRPNMALYTTIGSAHLEFLGDYDGVLRAKSEMLPCLPKSGVVFVNGDDEYLSKLTCEQKVVRYGVTKGCDVTAENVRILGTDGMELIIVSGMRRINTKINSFGVHMVTAALGAAAVGIHLGLTDAEIASGIAAYTPVGSRSGIIKTDFLTVIDDCYNANPTSTGAALKSLSLLQNRKVAVLGDMMELGDSAAKLHYDTGKVAADCGIDLLLTCGELSASTSEGAKDAGVEAIQFDSKEMLIDALPKLINKGDTVLVKASHSRRFEDIVEVLKNL